MHSFSLCTKTLNQKYEKATDFLIESRLNVNTIVIWFEKKSCTFCLCKDTERRAMNNVAEDI